MVDTGWRLAVQSLMRSFVAIEVKVLSQATSQFGHAGVPLEIDFLVFQCSPESLDEYVVQRAAFAIHADQNVAIFQLGREGQAGKLRSLVSIEYLWFISGALERVQQSLNAETAVHCVRQLPREHVPTVPINHRNLVHEAFTHWDVRDVGAPNMVGMRDVHSSKQVGIYAMFSIDDGRLSPPEKRPPNLSTI